ncbi:hypothetical protein [Micromonospora aurantiaca (nom. illeg.)]|uniref:hypothetical protein n=1 Tax=Micromonospora aurantiaca (nom. illeg.) TaxID=47850 RepID=UPI0037AFBBC6
MSEEKGMWIDRKPWTIPVIAFPIAAVLLTAWSHLSDQPVLLSASDKATRQQVYSSLTGSSSALLGFAIAAVAILAALAPRRPDNPSDRARNSEVAQEKNAARARTKVIWTLLATSLFLLVILVTASIAIAVDTRSVGNPLITVVIASASFASIAGLLFGGLGLSLAVVERSLS